MATFLPESSGRPGGDDTYLTGRGPAWFAFAMTLLLMLVDYIDRQVIVSLFPHMKADWGLSDKQLGALVSVVSVTVALGALPVALIADRASRVKSIVTMATIWSLASISCMFTRNYGQLFVARACVGLGEAGYGSVGAALIASVFPARMRGTLLAAFFATASVGSVLGVLLGGLIAAKWGWQAAFGVVGFPGLLLALLYLKVRDYKTVALTPTLDQATRSTGSTVAYVASSLAKSRTMLWVCLGGAAQLVVVSSVWSWLPSFLNRFHGMAPEQAAVRAALVVLVGAVGSVVWGNVIDRAGRRRPAHKLLVMATLCIASMAVLLPTFGGTGSLAPSTQFALVALGGFLMTCSVGPVTAIVIDVIHPGVRATGASVLALFQNLFGLAAGPFLVGVLSDAMGLDHAMTLIPISSVLAAGFFALASRTYESDRQRVAAVAVEVTPPPAPEAAAATAAR
ncbi:MAG: MFS transporter [Burkholderiaceae bacterium]|nr:MFS transporter [Burkholderiaceae bacterium]